MDTGVRVLLIGAFYELAMLCTAADIWVVFGTGDNFTHLYVNVICNAMEKGKSMCLPVFHDFTDCDTTSAFLDNGKVMARKPGMHTPK